MHKKKWLFHFFFFVFEKILRFCTTNSYFKFNHKFYKQTSGGPMDSSLTVKLAWCRIQKWEREALQNCHIPIRIWKDYVDDMLTCNELNYGPSYNADLGCNTPSPSAHFLGLKLQLVLDLGLSFLGVTGYAGVNRNFLIVRIVNSLFQYVVYHIYRC